ncbi:MAG: NAD-dependent epimerase/dehydratase family protein [Desulfarculaceae bacterium]|nr:NAD-dependent epimerase/dehydratase family protein [Desulfarculaceae bacterium]MCF8072947.1 NAD-dependent epimerase/dehydratase family protein [Desulfarculaceae bacterium]MCF8115498.1 NAD-dependent epimerase/dehydratase family protein [Desulfarculaceae bacterium]
MLENLNQAPQKPQRVVVIGASGFVGRNLAQKLEQAGIDCLGLGSKQVDLLAQGSHEALAGMLTPQDALVMCSALTPDKGRGIGTFMNNMVMVENLCRAMESVTPDYVLYLSSDAVYSFDQALVSEETPATPEDLYGTMHFAREMMLKDACQAPLGILRSTLVYGPGDTHNSYGPNRFRRMARDGEITLFGGGEETRDHILVTDLAEILLLMLTHKSAGLLNGATGQSHSFADAAQMVADQFGDGVEVKTTPRANPITHRSFDSTARLRAFPELNLTPLDQGVRLVHEQLGPQGD